MKKFLKIIFIVLLVILVILIATPFLFKGKIIETANDQLEKNLNAKASFSDINISLIRNFPNVSIRLKDLLIVGIDEFENDTLLNIRSFDVAVDIVSVIKMENIKIKGIYINKPSVKVIVLEDGKANWDIVPETPEEKPEDTTTTEFTTKISLKVFKISHANIKFSDYSSGLLASLTDFNFTLSGDLSKDFSALVIDSETEKVNLTMGGIRYAKNMMLNMHFDVDANLKESIFKLNENRVSLNELTLNFDGSLEMPESGDIITDLAFSTSNTDFKTLLSLVPAIYLKDFSDLQTTGTLKLDGKISGALTENTTPNV
ncbi:MAG: AsmA family protein, partial [Bacteroidales bacterium]